MANDVLFTFRALDKNVIHVAKKIARGMGRVTKKTQGLNRIASGTAARFRKIGHAANGMFGNLLAGVGAAAAIRKVITVGSQFEDSMADLQAITGASGKSLEFLEKQSLSLAKSSAIAQDKVASSFKLIASAKSELLEDPEGLVRVTEQVLKLANTGIDLDTAARTATQALNQFGQGADQAERFVNVLAAGAKIGASEVSETGVAILKAGAAAKNVGIKFEETNAAIQVLAKGGLKAELAGTGLKTALLKLENTGVKKIQPSVVGLSQALKNLKEIQLGTMQMTKLFGLEAFTHGSILTENAELVAKWTKEVTGSNEAQRQADIRLKTFSARMRRLGIVINTKLISLFKKLEPMITKNGEDFAKWIGQLDEEKVKGFADSLVLLAKGAVMVAKIFGKILKTLERIGVVIGEVSAALMTMDFSQFTKGTKGDLSGFARDISKAGSNPAAYVVRKLFEKDEPKPNERFRTSKRVKGSIDKMLGVGAGSDVFSFAGNSLQKSQADINVNINAPEGAVKDIKSKKSGSSQNIGVNMVTM